LTASRVAKRRPVMVVDGVILFTLAAHADEFASDEFA
jgi:hypothetical protein